MPSAYIPGVILSQVQKVFGKAGLQELNFFLLSLLIGLAIPANFHLLHWWALACVREIERGLKVARRGARRLLLTWWWLVVSMTSDNMLREWNIAAQLMHDSCWYNVMQVTDWLTETVSIRVEGLFYGACVLICWGTWMETREINKMSVVGSLQLGHI